MSLNAYWAYEFVCDHPLAVMLDVLNGAGPWTWALRDGHWYGEYLNCRPIEGVRVRIHEWPESIYSVLLQIETGSTAAQEAVDATMAALLRRLGARRLVETEPYD